MRKRSVFIASLFAVGAFASVAEARGASFPDDDVNPPRSGLIIEDVMDVREDGGGPRTNDVDVYNPSGRGCIENDRENRNDVDGADINCD